MANEEIKTFNVYNNSVRLIHIGGVQILPESTVAVIDDVNGINRDDVDTCEFLQIVDDGGIEPKPVKAEKSKSATGASWSSKG